MESKLGNEIITLDLSTEKGSERETLTFCLYKCLKEQLGSTVPVRAWESLLEPLRKILFLELRSALRPLLFGEQYLNNFLENQKQRKGEKHA